MQEKHLRLLEELDIYFKDLENGNDEFDNLLVQVQGLSKTVGKCLQYIEELDKEVAILKADSHAPQEYICCRKCGCKIAKTKPKK
jgi:hypothetical protein